jgi:hypothetical protein
MSVVSTLIVSRVDKDGVRRIANFLACALAKMKHSLDAGIWINFNFGGTAPMDFGRSISTRSRRFAPKPPSSVSRSMAPGRIDEKVAERAPTEGRRRIVGDWWEWGGRGGSYSIICSYINTQIK